jgi:cytidylate kinase
MMKNRILAIDGPAGAGKSTVARRVAERLGWVRVDTGAIYRSVALLAGRRGIVGAESIGRIAQSLDLKFEGERVIVDGEDVSRAIREPEISTAASRVSAMPEVRANLLELQRRIARAHPKGAVLEGRDIGTVVFPDAEVKVFLTASLEERARRRTEELAERGVPQPFDDVLAEMKERDERDAQRDVAPLKPAADAKMVDTTGRTIEEIVSEIVGLVNASA